MRVNDAVSGCIALLVGAVIVWIASGFPEMPGQSYGPALLPTIIGSGFILSGGVLILGRLRLKAVAGRESRPEFGADQLIDAAAVLGAILAFILLANWLGFLLTGCLVTSALMIWFRKGHIISSTIITAIVVFFVDYAFRKLLLVPLPLGPLKQLIW